MSEVDQFLNLMRDQQNPDVAVRESSEKMIFAAARHNPESFVSMCFHVIENTSIEKKLRISAVIVLRKALYSAQEDSVYRSLPPASQEGFRRNVLILLSRVEDEGVKTLVAELIGNVASALLEDKQLSAPVEQRWPDLVPHLFELFASQGTPSNVISVLKIFDYLFAQSMHALGGYLPQLAKLFEAALTQHTPVCRMQALETLVTLLQAMKRKDLKHVRRLKPAVLGFLGALVEARGEEELESGFGFLTDITETEPSFFKPDVDALLALAEKAFAAVGVGESGAKTQVIDALMPVFEGYPELFTQNPQRLEAFFGLIVKNMLDVEDEVSPEWKSPADGFNDELEEDDDQRPIKFSIDIVNRLFDIVGHKEMLLFLSKQIAPLIQSADWKCRLAALMVLSQAGEYMMEDMGQVGGVLAIVAQNAKDANPRLRYACCHLLGQFADDLAIKFQENFHKLYFEITLPMLHDDVPRVVAHCMASLTNFLENATKEQIAPHFDLLYAKLIGWLSNGICFVKEAALSALSALCEGAPELFENAVEPLMEIIFSIFKNAKAPIYKVLKGNAVECATILCKYTKPERFEKFATPLVLEMIDIVQHDISYDSADPQKSFLLSGFQRLALVMPEKLAPHLDAAMASLLHMAQASLGEGEAGAGAHTSLGEETELALQMMSSFLQNMPSHMVRYEEQIYAMMNLIIDKTLAAEVRVSALDVLGMLAKLYRSHPTASNQQVLRRIVERIWKVVEAEEDGETVADELQILEKVLKYSENCFGEAELTQLYARCKTEIQRSIERRAKLAEDIDEEDDAQDVQLAQKEREEIEEQVRVQISNIIGAMFKSHGATALPVFHLAVTELVNPALATPEGLKFALFLIDDAVEHLKALIPQPLLLYFLNAMVVNAQHKELSVRQACVFGMGVAALALGEQFEPVFENCYQAVAAVAALPAPGDASVKEHKACLDNCFSAQGKMVSALGGKLGEERLRPLLQHWLEGLPMLEDHKEGVLNLQMLLRLLQASPQLVLGADFARLHKLLQVFALVYHQKKVSTAQIDAGIQAWTRQLLANEQMKAGVLALPLEDHVKEFLNAVNSA